MTLHEFYMGSITNADSLIFKISLATNTHFIY